MLARHGLAAHVRHPLLGTVSVARVFYRPLEPGQYAACAQQVPDDFRCVDKAPALICDASIREPGGRGTRPTPHFLDPQAALQEVVRPALQGLRDKLGVLVFQAGPARSCRVRDAARLGPGFAAALRARGATHYLGLHTRLPPIDEQLPMLRALWPGPPVCRRNLHCRYGAQGHEAAKSGHEPYDRPVDPDPATRAAGST
ncbi:MAG: DUF72 domain-containing protein [Piscinibacter sp.]|uniref:DUF72 domain-containing protein n=1 Tax=Piscinibacter sp. TaxID=1903157 RepID=UPI003D0A8A29